MILLLLGILYIEYFQHVATLRHRLDIWIVVCFLHHNMEILIIVPVESLDVCQLKRETSPSFEVFHDVLEVQVLNITTFTE